jgi:alpha-D-ribose 1-methylphosphonate 5-triphosphate synthase subunit PhnH
MPAPSLSGGFNDAPVQAAFAFRSVMEAMARPGTLQTLSGAEPPAPLSVAAGSAVLTLCDPDTPIHLADQTDCPEVRSWIAFHTGAPVVDAQDAVFALGQWDDLLPLDQYAIGTAQYPDRSATLIVEVPHLAAEGHRLTGPGIQTEAALTLPDTRSFQDNARHFPLGLDFLFTCGDRIAALPRSTKVL